MNKKFLSAILFGALTVASTGSFVSCKDYDDDINNLQTQIGQLANKADLQSQVSTLQSAISTAQSAAEAKAAAAQKAADDAKAAADAAAKAAATATTESEKAAADAAAAKAAADAAASAADLKAAEEKIAALQTSLEEVEALAATLVKTEDFEAAKQELNDKYAALDAKVAGLTGTTGLVGIQVLTGHKMVDEVEQAIIPVGYGVWDGVHNGVSTATWDGPKKDEVAALAKGTYLSQLGANKVEVALSPTDFTVTENLDLAIVNKFGEVAPVLLQNPKTVTRANAAGAYEFQVVSSVKTGDDVKAFDKNFKEEGKTATLIANKISAQFDNNFVSVDQNKNASKSSFNTIVEFDDINGTVELVAKNPEFVYDAYILRIVSAPKNVQHDSLVYKISYNKGLAVSYDPAKVKAAIAKNLQDGNNFATLTFMVSQINLNGYIHNGTATVTFKGKETAKPVEKEAVSIAARNHEASIKVSDPISGAMLQAEAITMDEIKKALGYDKGSDDSIHFAHSTNDITLDGKPYYYNAENDKVEVETTLATYDEETGKIVFTANYPTSAFGTGNNDLLNGKTVYFTLKINSVDNNDLVDNPVVTNYYVVVPVKFSYPNLANKFSWTTKKITSNLNLATNVKYATGYSADDFTLFAEYVTENEGEDNEYEHSSLKSEVQYTSLAEYKKSYNTISNLPLGALSSANLAKVNSDVKVNGAAIEHGLTTSTVITADKRAEVLAKIKAAYYNSAAASEDTYVYDEADDAYRWEKNPDATTCSMNINASGLLQSENTTILVSGIQASVLGRKVPVASLTLTKEAASVTTAMTISVDLNKKGATFLYNSLYAPMVDNNFDGSFSLMSAAKKTLDVADVADADEIAAYEIDEFGGVSATATPGFEIAKVDYEDKNADGTANRAGLKITTPNAATGKTYKLVIKLKTYISNVESTSDAAETTFNINVNVKK